MVRSKQSSAHSQLLWKYSCFPNHCPLEWYYRTCIAFLYSFHWAACSEPLSNRSTKWTLGSESFLLLSRSAAGILTYFSNHCVARSFLQSWEELDQCLTDQPIFVSISIVEIGGTTIHITIIVGRHDWLEKDRPSSNQPYCVYFVRQ